MESAVHAAVPLRVGKKMRKRRELDALVGGGGSRGGRLLSASSDEGEPWGRRATRRRRSKPFVRLAAGLALCVCVVSAATVLWLFVDVRRQIVSLRIEMDRVSTSSESVGDALQICHSAAKELQANTTNLNTRLAKLEQEHIELVLRVKQVTGELTTLSDKLVAAPNLADTPIQLAQLQRTVADLGSQINGFDGALSSAKKQALTASSGVDEVRNVIHQLDARTNETIANVTANLKRDEQIKNDITTLNSTLEAKIEALQTRIEDIRKPTSTATPTVATSPATSTTTTTTPSTTTQPPGLKPNVLQ